MQAKTSGGKLEYYNYQLIACYSSLKTKRLTIKFLHHKKNASIIMKATEILHKDIVNASPEIYKTWLNTLFTFVRSGLRDTYLIRVVYNSSTPDQSY